MEIKKIEKKLDFDVEAQCFGCRSCKKNAFAKSDANGYYARVNNWDVTNPCYIIATYYQANSATTK